jgi:hypothetical protein
MVATPYGYGAGLNGTPSQAAAFLPRAYIETLTPAATAAVSVVEQTFTIAGVNVGDTVVVSAPGVTAGVGIAGARVTAANTVGISFANTTAGSLTAPAGVYRFVAFKCS